MSIENASPKVGIIAGSGALPIHLAQACAAEGRAYFVLRLAGMADAAFAAHPSAECGIAEWGKAIRLLKEAQCTSVSMAGIVRRPNFSALRPDLRGAALLPKVVAAAARGDGALLDVLIDEFRREGFEVVGAETLAQELLAPAGALGALSPTPTDLSDIQKASQLVATLDPFDVGQGAVVANGFVLAIEAAEGTDAMLERVAALPPSLRSGGERAGVLVKRPKPSQALEVDLPTIGVKTIERAAAAGLRGIAVTAGASLILNQEAVIAAADHASLFVFGMAEDVDPEECT